MNKKLNLATAIIFTLFFGIMLTGCTKKAESTGNIGKMEKIERNSIGQYTIGSNIQIYDYDLQPISAYFTYSPKDPTNLGFDNGMIILNFPPPHIDAAIFFGKSDMADNIGLFRYCIDKSIEWAATAKKENVSQLTKLISFDEFLGEENRSLMYGTYGLNQPNNRRYDAAYMLFNFKVLDEKGYEGPWLIMSYMNQNALGSGRQSFLFSFHEKDFASLKMMFSESYLAEIDKAEEAWQKSNAEKDSLFN